MCVYQPARQLCVSYSDLATSQVLDEHVAVERRVRDLTGAMGPSCPPGAPRCHGHVDGFRETVFPWGPGRRPIRGGGVGAGGLVAGGGWPLRK